MNYRHAFHAGNFADVMKHALLMRMLLHLGRKPAPFFVLDTHGGIGLYTLDEGESARTGEWREGIGRLAEPLAPEAEALLEPYRAALARIAARHGANAYPGSPLLIAEALRRGDRALACELHPADAETLAANLRPVPGIRALHLDGWTALFANIPPKERRGLVLIDPPYEVKDELARAVRDLMKAAAKWPTGVFALWYPIKDPAQVDAALAPLSGDEMRKVLRLELIVDSDAAPLGLAGCGLVVINPPWTLAEEAQVLLPALAGRLAGGRHAGWRCEWLAGE